MPVKENVSSRQQLESHSLSCSQIQEKVRLLLFHLSLGRVSQLGHEVFAFGSGEKGQLGNGRTGEHIVTGNKTAFDIETQPSSVRLHSWPIFLTDYSQCWSEGWKTKR
jgi:hypothetical protein